jgi:prepilin-type N-terminal cleavage/methylation domain-containing protein
MSRARRGFTLIEVVLAVMLSLALVVAMLMFYKQVTDVRAAVRAETQFISEEQTIMELMTRDLRASIIYPVLSEGIDGGAPMAVKMVTVGMPGGISWVVENVTTAGQFAPEPDIQVIGYRVRTEQDEGGQLVATGIERTCQRTPTLTTIVEGDSHGLAADGSPSNVVVTPLSYNIRFLYLRYWDGSAWQDSWTTGDLPGAVEIILGRDALPDGTDPKDYPGETFRRMVCVPGGVKPPTGTITLGLDASEGGLP